MSLCPHRSRWGRLFSKRPLGGLGGDCPKVAILDSSIKALVEKVRQSEALEEEYTIV